MTLVFKAEIKPAQVREATAGIFWRQVRQPKLLLALLALLLLTQALLYAVLPQIVWSVRALLLALMLFSLAGFGFAASQYYQTLALRNFIRFKGEPVQVELDEQAYRYSASWGQGAIEWERFQSLWRFPGVWVLLQHAPDGASVLLPTDDLSPEARAFIQRKISASDAGKRR